MSLAKPIEIHYELYGVPTNLINEERQFLDEKFPAKSIKCGVSVNWHLDPQTLLAQIIVYGGWMTNKVYK